MRWIVRAEKSCEGSHRSKFFYWKEIFAKDAMRFDKFVWTALNHSSKLINALAWCRPFGWWSTARVLRFSRFSISDKALDCHCNRRDAREKLRATRTAMNRTLKFVVKKIQILTYLFFQRPIPFQLRGDFRSWTVRRWKFSCARLVACFNGYNKTWL